MQPPVAAVAPAVRGRRNHSTSIGAPRRIGRESRALAHGRVPPVAAHDEVGAHFELAVRRDGPDAGDSSVAYDDVGDLGLHAQLNSGIALALRREKAQEIPLRHEQQARGMYGQMREIGDRDGATVHAGREPLHLLVRQPEKRIEQTELVDHFQRRRMDRVAAKIPEEVAVLFQHHDVDAGPREQKAEHHAAGPPPTMQQRVSSVAVIGSSET